MDKGRRTVPALSLDSEGLFMDGAKAYEMEGAVYFPATQVECLVARMVHDDSMAVQLCFVTASMLGNHVGIFLRMTPEGARELAGRLIADAQKVDNHVAAQAAAAIEAARQKGGPASSSGAVGPQGGL